MAPSRRRIPWLSVQGDAATIDSGCCPTRQIDAIAAIPVHGVIRGHNRIDAQREVWNRTDENTIRAIIDQRIARQRGGRTVADEDPLETIVGAGVARQRGSRSGDSKPGEAVAGAGIARQRGGRTVADEDPLEEVVAAGVARQCGSRSSGDLKPILCIVGADVVYQFDSGPKLDEDTDGPVLAYRIVGDRGGGVHLDAEPPQAISFDEIVDNRGARRGDKHAIVGHYGAEYSASPWPLRPP